MNNIYSKEIPFWQMRKKLKDSGLSECPPKGEMDRSSYYEAGVIRKEDLENGSYYWGTCRNSDIAMWDENKQCFWYIRTKFRSVFVESINHLEDDNGYDLFLPLAKIELRVTKRQNK